MIQSVSDIHQGNTNPGNTYPCNICSAFKTTKITDMVLTRIILILVGPFMFNANFKKQFQLAIWSLVVSLVQIVSLSVALLAKIVFQKISIFVYLVFVVHFICIARFIFFALLFFYVFILNFFASYLCLYFLHSLFFFAIQCYFVRGLLV